MPDLSENVIIVIVVAVVLLVALIIMGRRLRRFNVRAGSIKGSAERSNRIGKDDDPIYP
jgi:hypothetical protein